MEVQVGSFLFLIDPDDFTLFKSNNWYVFKIKKPYLATWKWENNSSKTLFFHRLILPVPKNMVIDHINGNTLDNRKSNLRICSNKDNVRNASNKPGKFKGVYYKKKVGKNCFYSKITVDYKQKFLGYFETKEDAAKAYDKAALEYFGEFANLNFKTGRHDAKKEK